MVISMSLTVKVVHKVCMYMIEYITSFGLIKSGMMQSPAGIVIDDDGFVYVCNFIKVYIF